VPGGGGVGGGGGLKGGLVGLCWKGVPTNVGKKFCCRLFCAAKGSRKNGYIDNKWGNCSVVGLRMMS